MREDVEVGGCTLPAGQLALLVLGAANRDPSAFDGGERLDVGAHAPRHPGIEASHDSRRVGMKDLRRQLMSRSLS